MYTILDLLRWSTSQFNSAHICCNHGTDNCWDEALHLILPSLYLPINTPTGLYSAHLTKTEQKRIIKKINRRIYQRIPVPYLTNKAWFCGMEFYVNNHVFIPRSPIGELISSNFHNILSNPPRYILDMCTGSGCIAIAAAKTYENSEVDAADISINALKIAEYNIQLYNLENRIFPINSNLFDKIPQLKYDLIIVNPPYINYLDINKLPKEFSHEPKISLFTKQNGLAIIHKILEKVVDYLNINGTLICEVGITKSLLIEHYPNIPFNWFKLKKGGDGVFSLNYNQLRFLKGKFNQINKSIESFVK